jgi:VWFA-related protein
MTTQHQNLLCLLVLAAFASISVAQTPLPTPASDRSRTFGHTIGLDRIHGGEKSALAMKTPVANAVDHDVIRVKTDLAVTDALVISDKGKVILGLKKDDFVLDENSVAKKIEYFTNSNGSAVPMSIVLIFDYSGSMWPFLKESVAAAKELIERLGPQDRMAIVSDDIALVTDFTNDKLRLKKRLDGLKKKSFDKRDGMSLQLSALYVTLRELFDAEDIRPVVILQSDGDEYWSLKTSKTRKYSTPPEKWIQRPCFGLCQNATFDNILGAVALSRATVYSIVPGYRMIGLSLEQQRQKARASMKRRSKAEAEIFGFSMSHPWAEDKTALSGWFLDAQLALRDLSTTSGGYIDFIEEPADAAIVYDTLFQTITSRYSIGYYPDQTEGTGSWRNVKVTVKNHPEYIVVGRKRFFIGGDQKGK